MRKLPSFSNGFLKEEFGQMPVKKETVSFDPKEDELKKLLEKYSELQSKYF